MGAPATGGVIYGPGIFQQVASKWHVPVNILLGVWGMETNFGQDVATSSAGAEGEFQFIPGTAKRYGYPLTNTPNQAQRNQQLDSAGHLLSDLFKQHGGSWDAALKAYSGGGYGLSQVQSKAKVISPNDPSTNPANVPSVGTAIGKTVSDLNPLNSVAAAITGVFNQGVTDLKYGAVLVGVLVAAAVLIVRGFGGDRVAARVMQARAGGE